MCIVPLSAIVKKCLFKEMLCLCEGIVLIKCNLQSVYKYLTVNKYTVNSTDSGKSDIRLSI